MNAPIRFRDRAVLEAQIVALSRADTVVGHTGRADDTAAFQQGATEALQWVVEGGPGPLTGSLHDLPLSLRAVVAELASAEEFIYGQVSRHRDYACGVEEALMWARFATPDAPAPPRHQPSAAHAG